MRLIIAGSRSLDHNNTEVRHVLFSEADKFIALYKRIYEVNQGCNPFLSDFFVRILSGCAGGIDTLGIEYARECSYELKKFPPNWDEHGKAAGIIRNKSMGLEADALLAAWDGTSKGTKHMIEFASKRHLRTHVVLMRVVGPELEIFPPERMAQQVTQKNWLDTGNPWDY